MKEQELVKRVEDLEKKLELAEESIRRLFDAMSRQPHPMVINSLINESRNGSILDGIFG